MIPKRPGTNGAKRPQPTVRLYIRQHSAGKRRQYEGVGGEGNHRQGKVKHRKRGTRKEKNSFNLTDMHVRELVQGIRLVIPEGHTARGALRRGKNSEQKKIAEEKGERGQILSSKIRNKKDHEEK